MELSLQQYRVPMTSVDILFWLLLVLMGGITWAIESGLGHRHRTVLGSSMIAALGSAGIIMFVIDDTSQMVMPGRTQEAKKVDQGDDKVEERGQVDFGGSKKKRRVNVSGNGGGSGAPDGGSSGSSGTSDSKNNPGAQDDPAKSVTVDPNSIVYSREPFKDCPMCPEMVIISADAVFIGSPLSEPGRADDEPEATLTTFHKAFAVGRVEITRAEYAAFAREADYKTTTRCDLGKRRGTFDWTKPGFEQDERHPVVCVSIRDVEAYLDWVSQKSGRNYQLPTAGEWEFAARGDTDTPYWVGDDVNRTQANIGRSRDGTMPTGVFAANKYGVSDVIGNAAEMTGQCMPEPKSAKAPVGEKPPCRRIVKGGDWTSNPASVRHAARNVLLDGNAQNYVGFRVMRYVDQRDDHRILSEAEKLAQAKADALAAEIEQKTQEAAAKAQRDAREASRSAAETKKAMEEARAKARAEGRAKAEAEKIAKFKEEQKKAQAKK